MKVSVIIPSLNPDNKLVAVVDALLEEGLRTSLLLMMEVMRNIWLLLMK